MAAGGGSFITYNKVLPGAYINFVSKARALGTLGERGVAAFLWNGSWGAEDCITEVSNEDFQKYSLSIFGYDYTDSRLKNLRELFKGARTALVYRPKGVKASAKLGNITVTAKYGGTRGNDIRLIIDSNVDGGCSVITMLGENEVDEQTVKSAEELLDNDYICFSGSGTLEECAGLVLEGGSNAEISGNDYSEFIEKIEAEDFTVIFYDGDDDVTKSLFAEFTKRLRDEEGYKVSCVLHGYSANHEGVINVANMTDEGGTELVYWVAGQTAGAEVNQSLTNALYDGEYGINTKYTKSQLKEMINSGCFAFYGDSDGPRVLKDINSFVSITSAKNSDFTNNQVIRVLDSIANDTARIFDRYYLGKVQNNETGRTIFKSELIAYHEQLQSIEAITNFESADIEVVKGTEKGDVIVNEYVEPVAAMDKLYMTCVIE